ncbi:MAG: hypothetical protein ACLU70_07545 [Lachnospira sp.]
MEENIIIMPMFAALMITLIVVIASAFIKKDTEPVKQELINISHRKSIYRKIVMAMKYTIWHIYL